MNRRFFLTSLIAAGLAAGSAQAATYQERIVNELRDLGYSEVIVQTTLLGRVRIRATKGRDLREIVLNPRTGEVLRDVVHRVAAESGKGRGRSGSSSGGNDDDKDDDDKDDDDKDEDKDDNSGSGSDSSKSDDDSDSDSDKSGKGED